MLKLFGRWAEQIDMQVGEPVEPLQPQSAKPK
jgi:hypothetical protein